MEHPSYYAILSANVRYDKNISDKAKLLFADITALSNKNGYCTASNNYFAELFDVKKETISRNISSLEKAGHVKVELVYKGKEVIQRRIYPITQTSIPIDKKVNTPIDKKVNTPIDKKEDTLLTKTSIPIDKNMITPIDENVKENITSINNTRNNITSSNNDMYDMNDKDSGNQDYHTDHSNHLSDNKFDNSLEEKEIEVQNMPKILATYLMNYDIKEIKSIKSSLLKAKSSFYNEVEVEERMTIEDIEEHLIAALKRINVKSRKSNEPIENLEAYMFKTFKTTFFANVIWNDDETVDGDPEMLRAFFEDGIASGY